MRFKSAVPITVRRDLDQPFNLTATGGSGEMVLSQDVLAMPERGPVAIERDAVLVEQRRFAQPAHPLLNLSRRRCTTLVICLLDSS